MLPSVMATILRVKRRREDGPLDTVVVSCKKRRDDNLKEQASAPKYKDEVQNLLKYAGTVHNKEASISKPIRDAIRKDKLEKEYKRHETNISERSRQQRKHAAKQNRFKIIASHRTIQLEDLDQSDTEINSSVSPGDTKQKTEKPYKTDSGAQIEIQEGHICSKCGKRFTLIETNRNHSNILDVNKVVKGDNLCQKCGSVDQHPEKVFQLYDVEWDTPPTYPSFDSVLQESQNTSGITCNSVQLIKEVVPRDSVDIEENYVYDLYYTNNRDFNLQLIENNLSIEAFKDVFCDEDAVDEEEGLYDDDDDSNDESNWRNDYPDEDPRFFENEDLDSNDYSNNFDEHVAFGNYGEGELAEYMSSRCNIEDGDDLSSDDEDHTYFGEQLDPMYSGHGHLGYEQYYKMVKKEMEEDCEQGDDEDKEIDEP